MEILFFVLILQFFKISTQAQDNSNCVIHELPNFNGNSIILKPGDEIHSFNEFVDHWQNNKFRSIKLTNCELSSCSLEDPGNCRNFNVSKMVVLAERLKSLLCNCVNYRNFAKSGKKIIGIARNYEWKTTELANGINLPSVPLFFLKPTTTYLLEGNPIRLPRNLGSIYYEIELGVVIGSVAKNVQEEQALDYIAGYFLSLDLTAKEMLNSAISNGHPWSLAKGFDGSTPVGPFIPKSLIPNPNEIQLSCSINKILRQNETTAKMTHGVKKLIAHVSNYMTLEPNDVILTGTPDGIGALSQGDVIEGTLGSISKIRFEVV